MVSCEGSPPRRMNPVACWSRQRRMPATRPMLPPATEIRNPSARKMRLTCRCVAPSARKTAIFSVFSIISIDMVERMLNDAIMRINASMRNVIHFSISIMRKEVSSWAMRSAARYAEPAAAATAFSTAEGSAPGASATSTEVASAV